MSVAFKNPPINEVVLATYFNAPIVLTCAVNISVYSGTR